jgi:hypothetical protein
MPTLLLSTIHDQHEAMEQELCVETGTVCRDLLGAKEVKISKSSEEVIKLNFVSNGLVELFDESSDYYNLQQRVSDSEGDLAHSILLFTPKGFRTFKQWVLSEEAKWASEVGYLLIQPKCKINLTDKEAIHPSSDRMNSDESIHSQNWRETSRTVFFYLKSLTKGTKLGLFWIAFRAVASPVPVLFAVFSVVDKQAALQSVEGILLSLSVFSFIDGGIKHGVRSWRRLRNFDRSTSRLSRVLFMGSVGIVESLGFLLAATIVVSISKPSSLSGLFFVWVLSIPAAVFMGGMLGMLMESIAKKFWDIKFISAYFQPVILITTPILITPQDGLLKTVHDYNPLSMAFRLSAGFAENNAIPNSSHLWLYLVALIILVAIFFRRT